MIDIEILNKLNAQTKEARLANLAWALKTTQLSYYVISKFSLLPDFMEK